MRRVLSLLLTAAMVLSLLVVAGAEQQTVTLKTAKSVNGNEVTYTFTLDATGTKGVGALSFDVKTTNLTFKANSDVYNEVLDTTFRPGVAGVQDGSYGFHTETNRFVAYGGNGAKEGTRLLKDSVWLVSLTYTIEDADNYSLEVTEFKACYSGAEAMTTNKYNCVIAPIGGGSTGNYDITPVGKGDNTPAYEVEGTNLTVTYSVPCAVAYTTDGVTYTRVKTTSGSDDSYVFDLSAVPADAKISVVVKGDVNGDGVVSVADKMLVARSLLLTSHPAYRALTGTEVYAADLDGSGTVVLADKMLLARSLLLPGHAAYKALTW